MPPFPQIGQRSRSARENRMSARLIFEFDCAGCIEILPLCDGKYTAARWELYPPQADWFGQSSASPRSTTTHALSSRAERGTRAVEGSHVALLGSMRSLVVRTLTSLGTTH